MKVLIINKFLHPNGGSETYIFKLGEHLASLGHDVQYFGMEHENRIVSNNVNSYTENMDFHTGSKLKKLTYPLKTIYSSEARKKLRAVLDDFSPDVCHINNFNYQLTPSIIVEIRKWSKQKKHKCRIVHTAHDLQLVCPNHLMMHPVTKTPCTLCLGGKYINCSKKKCIHFSRAKSIIGTLEAYYWKLRGIYREFDAIICPSQFHAEKLKTNSALSDKIIVMHNFIDKVHASDKKKIGEYVLYYGRYGEEKGINTLLNAIDKLQDIPFVFAGNGELEHEINKRGNIENRGFLSGDKLKETIENAAFTVIPSECFENCPFTVMESQMHLTPVLGASIGGIVELIKPNITGELFTSGNAEELYSSIRRMWDDKELIAKYSENCKTVSFDSIDEYTAKLLPIYSGTEIYFEV